MPWKMPRFLDNESAVGGAQENGPKQNAGVGVVLETPVKDPVLKGEDDDIRPGDRDFPLQPPRDLQEAVRTCAKFGDPNSKPCFYLTGKAFLIFASLAHDNEGPTNIRSAAKACGRGAGTRHPRALVWAISPDSARRMVVVESAASV